jgi:serine/threonine protein kinase
MPPPTDPGALLAALRDALATEYEIEGFAGRGSVALLYKGMERAPQRAVALKVVPPGAAEGFGERVRREARVASNLVHPNIVPIYKAAQAAGADFYTMKWVDGCSLDWVLLEEGPLPVPLALTVLRSVARGLAYAHDRHVLHRDLRGAKVLVDREGIVAVADTGLARALRDQGSEAAVGSPLFRSPEQCSGQPVGPQADQYALGVLAFQMLTGRPPFTADSEGALLGLHVSAQPPEIGMTRLDVPQELVDVVRRALTKTPAERYSTTQEMLNAIEAVPLSEEAQKAAVVRLQELARRAPQPELVTERSAVQPVAPPLEEPALREMELATVQPPPPAPGAKPSRPSGLLIPLPAPPPAPITWEPLPASEAPAAPPPAPAAPPPPAPRRSSSVAAVPPVEQQRPTRSSESLSRRSSVEQRRFSRSSESLPRRSSVERKAEPLPRSPLLGRILGILALVGITVLAVMVLGKRVRNAPSLTAAARDSMRAKERADSIATFAPLPTVGWVKVHGDLPDDAVLWLDDQQRVKGPIFAASPGRHSLEVQTDEFEPWESKIRVRLGDTLIVEVELVLIRQSEPSP